MLLPQGLWGHPQALVCSHKICWDTFHNKVSEILPKSALWGHLRQMPFRIIVLIGTLYDKGNDDERLTMNEIDMIVNTWH